MIENINELKQGCVLSESSHYVIGDIVGDTVHVTHFESGDATVISKRYLEHYTNSADLYTEVVKVTKEDKLDGTLGIRSIFEGIHSGQVFTVCFKKQDKPKSKRQYDQELADVVSSFSDKIDIVKNSKKGIANAAKELVANLLANPILPYTEGEDRVLRGYKVQFESRDGKYKCVDMDIEQTDKESGVRPVNINTIKWLIYNGIKYVVV